jgi:phosphoribosyl 1,2-cyclic phosphodiesterase
MRIRFWGTRGSLPVALTAPQVLDKVATALVAAQGQHFTDHTAARVFASSLPFDIAQTFGGHSSCVELEINASASGPRDYFLCDMGSGARPFGAQVIAQQGPRAANRFHIFLSHVHWDHIMGLPLFTPAYLASNEIYFYGCHRDLEAALRRQHGAPSFPVAFEQLAAKMVTVLYMTIT